MSSVAVLSRLRWAFVVWLLLLPSATVAGADSLVVQQIGDQFGQIAEAVASEVTVVPFSPDLDARTTPIILATGKAFVRQGLGRGNRVGGLRPEERRAIRQSYDAGQVILLLDASTHDVEALLLLLDDGVAHESSTDPGVLAYALRSENNIATARLVTHGPVDDDLAFSQALDIVIEELTRPPAIPEDDVASSTDWGSSPVQSTIITSTADGTYNTPIAVYALHSCKENMDYYLVNTGGDWAATNAGFESASTDAGEMSVDDNGNMTIGWEDGDQFCTGGINIAGIDERICRYRDYPRSYEVDILPPSGPTVVQVNAAPAGDQGQSSSYQSGFSFSIGGGVQVSGKGPSAGIQTGVNWNNSVSTTVPPLVIHAGDMGNEGTFTKYLYCTAGDTVANCTSTIQMVTPPNSGLCQNLAVGPPQNGQTPDGRLSNVAQTVNWQVDPGTYTGSTFDITVTFQVDLATSTSNLWSGRFKNDPQCALNCDPFGPAGYCNAFGCNCSISSQSAPTTVSHTFKVPFPSSDKCPS